MRHPVPFFGINFDKSNVRQGGTLEKQAIACAAPACVAQGLAEAMWLPAWDALRRANGGRRVVVADLPKFALCRIHGRLLRKENVPVYPFAASFETAKKAEERTEGERLRFRPFADLFKKREQPKDGARRVTR